MCGRFTLTLDPDELQEAFPQFIFPEEYRPRYNIAPSQPVLAIPNDGSRKADFFKWGLIPSWAKDPTIGNRMINARSETLTEKPSFRTAFKKRRCIILADGFFEWQSQTDKKTKIPHYIHLKSRQGFGFAGLWEDWHASDGSGIKSCTIITTSPNDLLAPIHKRMPVILPQSAYETWLDPVERSQPDLVGLLGPYPGHEMAAYPISKLVNQPSNDVPQVLEPINGILSI